MNARPDDAGAFGARSPALTLPLSPRRAAKTAMPTDVAMVAAANAQQATSPLTNENDPSDC